MTLPQGQPVDSAHEEKLTIGEAARLAGVPPKAIRHYHRIGLLAEPERSEGGYRLYGAEDLLRLARIRRLRALGLSGGQVKEVLGEPSEGRALESILRALLDEVSAEISALQECRRRIMEVLAEGGSSLDAEPSPTFECLKQVYGDRLPEASRRLWEQEERIWATLDAFEWPEGYPGAAEEFVRHLSDHPELLRRMLELGERLAALSDAPEDSPEVEELAAEYAQVLAEGPLSSEPPGAELWPQGALGSAMSGMMLATLSPAQRRVMELVQARLKDWR